MDCKDDEYLDEPSIKSTKMDSQIQKNQLDRTEKEKLPLCKSGSAKRSTGNAGWSSDDEGFAGFEDYAGRDSAKKKKIKQEPLTDTDNDNDSDGNLVIDIKQELEMENDEIANNVKTNDTVSFVNEAKKPIEEKFRKPFEYGWKRELVYRAQSDEKRAKSDKGEVYYITPNGKKLRTKNEIQLHLQDDLDVSMFTFTKEALGMGPEDEIIRSAKSYTSSTVRRANFLDLGEPDPTLGFGKRIPKPKMPKGASPPPAIIKSRSSLPQMKRAENILDNENNSIRGQKMAKLKGEPCTMQCVLAMGSVPQLQCKKCLCLFHNECVGLAKYDGAIANYICESCLYELAIERNTVPSSTPATVDQTPKQPNVSIDANAPSNRTTNDHKESNNSVIGGITTWLPPTANITTNRAQLDINTKPPQSIAIIAGRKYIMVPKMNLMSVSPSGEVKIGDNNGIPLSYVDEKKSSAPTTGDNNVAPAQQKKRNAPARNTGSSKQPSTTTPTSSPNKIQFAGNNLSTGQDLCKTTSLQSIHTMFASNFFSHVSIGYDILLHIFQYLKVQELLRASCVCRMWNQAASNSILWKTVRMKNSQVNDWSGLANTIKRNYTKHLDLRKMLIPGNNEVAWQNFSVNIGNVDELERIDLCRCSSKVIEQLFETNKSLRVLNAVAIKDDHIDLSKLGNLAKITELRLKSLNTLSISSLLPFESLVHLKHLSLTSIQNLNVLQLHLFANLVSLESLEIGECVGFNVSFATDVLSKLQHLERLRLEKGQGEECPTFEILETVAKLPNLVQLELVNFDIKFDFDKHLQKCTNLKRLLIIPTYISQSATTNHMILNGVLKLSGNLEKLVWVVTLELLRVTELYVDQCENNERDRKLAEDKIPILKPVPGITEEVSNVQKTISDVPQVEILPLHSVEKILNTNMPNTKHSILKVAYVATWRQYMHDLP